VDFANLANALLDGDICIALFVMSIFVIYDKSDDRPYPTRDNNRATADPREDRALIGIFYNSPQPGRHFLKTAGPKHKPITIFHLRQIPDSHFAASRKSALAQTVNRTKMFHVKHFCPIGGKNLTTLMFYTRLAQKRWILPQASSSTSVAVA
jgi:hypothetical protein